MSPKFPSWISEVLQGTFSCLDEEAPTPLFLRLPFAQLDGLCSVATLYLGFCTRLQVFPSLPASPPWPGRKPSHCTVGRRAPSPLKSGLPRAGERAFWASHLIASPSPSEREGGREEWGYGCVMVSYSPFLIIGLLFAVLVSFMFSTCSPSIGCSFIQIFFQCVRPRYTHIHTNNKSANCD